MLKVMPKALATLAGQTPEKILTHLLKPLTGRGIDGNNRSTNNHKFSQK